MMSLWQRFAAVHESAIVKVFGCRPNDDGAAGSEGRRRKTSKGGNRDKGRCGGAACAMGIWSPRRWCVSWGKAIERT